MKIAVLGAGITGLSAAYRLTRRIAIGTLPPETQIVVFDRRPRIGGVLETVTRDGHQIEQSADNFITTVPWGIDLCCELGIDSELVQTNADYRRTYVVRHGRLHLLPDGFLMMAPTKLWPLATTPLLSPFGKLRAGLELLLPARRDDSDESMAHFVKRRLGREVFERLVEPLISGVYAADMEKLSVLATMPRFRDMERTHRSLILAMRSQMLQKRRADRMTGQKNDQESGARYSMFVTLRSGLSRLCETLAAHLPPDALRLDCEIVSLAKERPSESGRTQWSLRNSRGETESFDHVIAALPAHAAARLLRDPLPEIGERLGRIEHQGTAIVTLAFRPEQIRQSIRGMGFVVPTIERSPLLAGSFSSLKYEHRVPNDNLLLRLFAGGARAPEMAEMPDAELIPLLCKELKRIIRVDGDPIFTVTAHWPRTMPQYHVGHRELIADTQTLLLQEPTIRLAGNYIQGVGIPNCMHSGQIAAESLANE